MGTIADKLTYLQGTKNAIKQAITDMGQPVSDTDTFRSYADKIKKIENTVPNDLDDLVDGKLTSFIMPTGKTAIRQYLFYQMTSLVSANLGAAITIGTYAFYNCVSLRDFTLPSTLTRIDDYGLYGVGSSSNSTFTFSPSNDCLIGNYAFNGSKISDLSGKITSIGNYAFYNCSRLTSIDLSKCGNVGTYAFSGNQNFTKLYAPIRGSIGSYAFNGCIRVSDLDLSGSVITSVGEYAFASIGGSRSNPSQNILLMDFRESTFTAINRYSFGSNTSSTGFKHSYMIYKFPLTLKTIAQFAFSYSDNCDYYFTSTDVPTLSATTTWNNATNYRIFIPYENIVAYRSATNWTAQSNYLRGYSDSNAFNVGDTLPEYNAEGYKLTWYKDKNLTEQVTTVEDANSEYYCTAGEQQMVFKISTITALDCTVTLTDGTKTYVQGDDVFRGTVLTITGTPTTEGYTPYLFKVNDEDFTSGNTATVESDIKITAIYWDGEHIPINPTFSENTWDIIATAFKTGVASQLWSAGDTKSITSKSGKTYTIRIADMQSGRYDYTDGSGSSNGVLEFVELYNLNEKITWQMNAGNTNTGGWANSYLRNTILPTLLADLPDDMVEAISEVNVLSGTGGGSSSGTSSSANKIFIPAEMEMFDAKHYSIGITESPLGQFDYYKAHNTNTDRIKRFVGTTNVAIYWLRSPDSGNSSYFCAVSGSGGWDIIYAYYSYGVGLCFAI